MNIFSEVKEYLTARQVAENYGLQVRRNGLACCPFHDDKHPSMKIDKNYHCFACGVGGDVIDYVSRMFGLSQYEAALKIVEDFRLPIEVKRNKELREQDRERIRRERTERERLIHIRERFDRWCNHSIESLRDGLLWSSIFVTLVAKKYLVPAMSPSLHVEWHNHYNYVGAHNCIQHMQSHLLPGRELLPFQTHTGWCTHFSMC